MQTLIIEDEAPAFRRLQKVLEEINSDIHILEVLDSVEESIKWFNNHKMPDIVFMDIQLSDGLSFEIFEKVHITSPVIFTTAFDEYMLKAFKVNSIDYLLKPIKKEDLAHSLKKYKELKSGFGRPADQPDLNELIKTIRLDDKQFKNRFLVKKSDQLLSIPVEDVAFFHTHNGLVYLKTHAGRGFVLDFTLDEIMNQIDPNNFFRVNRQFVINFKSIKAVHKWYKGKLMVETYLPTDEQVTISAEKASQFKSWLDS